MNKEIISKVRGSLLILTAFLIPFMPKFISLVIGLTSLTWVLEGDFRNKFVTLRKNKPGLLLIAFYLLHVIGLLWSDNMDYGLFDLQIKLSFLVMPIIIMSSPLPGISSAERILRFFIFGCISATIFCISRAIYYYFNGHFNYFFYKDFSYFIHPGYFSMYLCFAAICVLEVIRKNKFSGDRVVIVSNLLILIITSVAVVLLASKAGILILLILLMAAAFFLIKTGKPIITGMVIFVMAGMLIFFGMFSPITSGRMEELKETLTSTNKDTIVHTSEMRVQAWKSALALISISPVMGTGTGDVKDELVKMYGEKGYVEIMKLRLNAHNQFLQTASALGIIGLLLLLTLLFIALRKGIIEHNNILTFFIIIIVLNACVESVLEVAAGAVFFSFFFAVSPFAGQQVIDKTKSS